MSASQILLSMSCIALARSSSIFSSSFGSIANRRMIMPQMASTTMTMQQQRQQIHGSSCSGAFIVPSSRHRQTIAGGGRSVRRSFAANVRLSIQTNHDATSTTTTTTANQSNSSWDNNSNSKCTSQSEFMLRDTVLVTDQNDNILSSATKKSSHEFSPSQPHGILHRAFSVFLLDSSTNELLLQKRASSKITFPNVWTNTCCSHPLHGMDPSEVDDHNGIVDGQSQQNASINVAGVKNAAVRKLEHELGIPRGELGVEEFKFLTRVQYWAADTVTHGEDSPWGEHEIDYILFITIPSKEKLTLQPHPEEVDETRWVSQSQLLEMFDDASLLFSPWFRIIAQRWLMVDKNSHDNAGIGNNEKDESTVGGWWDDLDRTMNTDDFCDYNTIHRFDPTSEHMGGAGSAGPLFDGPM
eukprot:CAMPEP_0172317052 /NCGR_PEP_ID=MMETSP1058-20130122/30377_1 /TAXON_ID=83371 /ORGANISM="Detonula confervacea, Strain CCMP 353" /LENGTH=411 /DNA_ID=CAMNT_0013031507 /DNA_START=28 /DNA_END=1263 /DNA_ORIENTATION=+